MGNVHTRHHGLWSVLLLGAALAACSGEEETQTRERMAAPPGDAIARKSWLQPTDGTVPALWLASRDAGHDLASGAPEAEHWKTVLADAGERFGETDRMIANRAAQLETMLADIGIKEGAGEIVAGFAALTPKGARAGFSDLCQHYYNLRVRGLSREDSLKTLRDEIARRPNLREVPQ